jgi:hypothetical protein
MGVYNNNKDGTRSTLANTIQVIDAPMEQFVSRGEFNAVVPSDTSADNKLVNDVTVNDIWKVQGENGGGKNLLKPLYSTNNAIFTINDDGSVTIDGTSSSYAICQLVIEKNAFPHGDYILSWDIDGTLQNEVQLQYGYSNLSAFTFKSYCNQYKQSESVTIDNEFDGKYINIRIVIPPNLQINNVTVYPMLRNADDTDTTWKPYTPTNAELSEGIKNYNDIKDSKTNVATIGALSSWGGSWDSVVNDVITMTSTTTQRNVGARTPLLNLSNIYEASATFESVDFTGSFSLIAEIWKSNNTREFLTLGAKYSVNVGDIVNLKATVDCPNFAVYKDAVRVDILFNCSFNDSQTGGTYTLSNINVYKKSALENLPIYADTFPALIQNLYEAIPSTVEPSKFIHGGNGNNYLLKIDSSGNLIHIPTIPNKTIFVGNSLLLGMGNYGMCATDSEHDYYHYVSSAILAKNNNATFTKIAPNKWEQATSADSVAQWLLENDSYFTNDIDLIILQIGDNVNTAEKRAIWNETYDSTVHTLLTKCPNARIICVGFWYNSASARPAVIDAVNHYGLEFVDITTLHTKANEAVSGQTYVAEDGTIKVVPDAWITHPGNDGMRAIADKIIETLNM